MIFIDTEEVTKSGSLLPLGKNSLNVNCIWLMCVKNELLCTKSAISQLGTRISK